MLNSQLSLADLVRAATAGRDVLYHGTRGPKAIFKTGKLFFARVADPVVCFTRSPEKAAYWARLERDGHGPGAVLIFSRRSLSTRYRLEPYCDDPDQVGPFRREEMEERVYRTNVEIGAHLTGYVSDEAKDRTPEERRRAHQYLDRLKKNPGRAVRTLPMFDCKAWMSQEQS